MKKYIYIMVAAVTFSSCGIYTKFTTPEVKTENLAGDSVELPDTAVVALPTWQEYFTDAQLREYITIALEANSDLQITRLNVSQAERGVRTSRLAYLPTIAFSPEGSISGLAGGTSIKSYSIPITASWELDLFGRKYNTKHQAMSVLSQTVEQERLVTTQLIAGVATNYYALILADEQLRISNRSLDVLRQTLSAQESLKEVGMQTQLSVEQTKASVKSFELTIKDIEKSISLLENDLCLLLNMTPRKLQRAESFSYSAPIEGAISLSALSNRPDVRYAEMLLAQCFYGENYARSSLYPSISIGGSVGWTNYFGSILDPADFLLSILGSITQPIFAGGANRANLQNAKDRYEQQLITFEKSLLAAGKEVNDALIEIQNTKEKASLSKSQIETLQYAVELSIDLMNGGKSNYLEVLVAQNSYLSAQLNGVAVEYANAIAQINLYKSLGGGN